jgi:hypothetical protein
MRKVLLAAAGAGAILTAATVVPAGALPLDPGAMRPAINAVSPVEKSYCYGWRCRWGYGYGRHPYYGYRPYYPRYYYWR